MLELTKIYLFFLLQHMLDQMRQEIIEQLQYDHKTLFILMDESQYWFNNNWQATEHDLLGTAFKSFLTSPPRLSVVYTGSGMMHMLARMSKLPKSGWALEQSYQVHLPSMYSVEVARLAYRLYKTANVPDVAGLEEQVLRQVPPNPAAIATVLRGLQGERIGSAAELEQAVDRVMESKFFDDFKADIVPFLNVMEQVDRQAIYLLATAGLPVNPSTLLTVNWPTHFAVPFLQTVPVSVTPTPVRA